MSFLLREKNLLLTVRTIYIITLIPKYFCHMQLSLSFLQSSDMSVTCVP